MNITDALVPYFEGKISLEEATDNTVNIFYKTIINKTYKCENCGETIPPKISVNEHGIFIDSEIREITGGLGNTTLVKRVCQNCYKEFFT